jgi:single-strand DNA-binding protein
VRAVIPAQGENKMAIDVNSLVIIGNLTRDMELSYIQGSGTAVGQFGIAVNYRKGNADAVSFFNCKAFGKQAENLKPYLLKGKKVAIAGTIRCDNYKDKEGNNKSAFYIVCDSIQLLGGADKSSPKYVAKNKADVDTSTDTVPTLDGFPEDIPF